jgi:hypothetical protein
MGEGYQSLFKFFLPSRSAFFFRFFEVGRLLIQDFIEICLLDLRDSESTIRSGPWAQLLIIFAVNQIAMVPHACWLLIRLLTWSACQVL